MAPAPAAVPRGRCSAGRASSPGRRPSFGHSGAAQPLAFSLRCHSTTISLVGDLPASMRSCVSFGSSLAMKVADFLAEGDLGLGEAEVHGSLLGFSGSGRPGGALQPGEAATLGRQLLDQRAGLQVLVAGRLGVMARRSRTDFSPMRSAQNIGPPRKAGQPKPLAKITSMSIGPRGDAFLEDAGAFVHHRQQQRARGSPGPRSCGGGPASSRRRRG